MEMLFHYKYVSVGAYDYLLVLPNKFSFLQALHESVQVVGFIQYTVFCSLNSIIKSTYSLLFLLACYPSELL